MRIPSWKQEDGKASGMEILQTLNAINVGDLNPSGTDYKQAIKWSGLVALLEAAGMKDQKYTRLQSWSHSDL